MHPGLLEAVEIPPKAEATASALEGLRIEFLIHLVEFVDQQHTWLFAFERPHQRTRTKEIASLEVGLQLAPVPALAVPLRKLHVKPLEALVEPPDCLVLRNVAVALQPLMCVPAACATDTANCVLPLPAGPSNSSGFCILAAR